MIYMVKEIKAPEERSDGSAIPFTGQWEILDHFNLNVVAIVYVNKATAEKIVNLLNADQQHVRLMI